ncbi:hypothetical protein GUK30_14115 [Rhizobium leguminosarum]|uniref:hypothetical protein n=1 Tax=Rhizobium ruizarguesonis TaxID=2081791 RepID=UPI0013BFB724|nr:hypothetical protein [Rhizobium ruizarguesonis]NEI20545.1 hypothetical protein [Rhizobium ruizarguesonis]
MKGQRNPPQNWKGKQSDQDADRKCMSLFQFELHPLMTPRRKLRVQRLRPIFTGKLMTQTNALAGDPKPAPEDQDEANPPPAEPPEDPGIPFDDGSMFSDGTGWA